MLVYDFDEAALFCYRYCVGGCHDHRRRRRRPTSDPPSVGCRTLVACRRRSATCRCPISFSEILLQYSQFSYIVLQLWLLQRYCTSIYWLFQRELPAKLMLRGSRSSLQLASRQPPPEQMQMQMQTQLSLATCNHDVRCLRHRCHERQ